MALELNGTTGVSAVQAGAVESGDLPAGSVIQVVSATKTDTFSTNVEDETFVDIPGLNVSLTPSSTDSKIIIMASIGKASVSDSNRTVNFLLDRDGTPVGIGDARSNRLRISFATHHSDDESNGRGGLSASINFVDTPESISPLTYKIKMSGHAGNTTVVNRSAADTNNDDGPNATTISTLIVMEVAG